MIKLIGYARANVTIDMANRTRLTDAVDIISPDVFLQNNFDIHDQYIITVIRDLGLRKKLSQVLDNFNLTRATWIDPTAQVSSSAKILPGTWIGPFSSVFCNAIVGKDCIVAPYSMISHGVQIGQNTIVNPGTMIAGSTQVGSACTFGLRSTVLDHINICDNVYVGAGALVNKDIKVPGCYVGSPARKIAKHTDFCAIDNDRSK